MHGVTLEQEHNAHVNEEEQDFDDCYQVVVHCESKDEAREVGELVSDHFSEPDGDTKATGGRADA